jgi:hypothetical protein
MPSHLETLFCLLTSDVIRHTVVGGVGKDQDQWRESIVADLLLLASPQFSPLFVLPEGDPFEPSPLFGHDISQRLMLAQVSV